jgi:hypothetical protein
LSLLPAAGRQGLGEVPGVGRIESAWSFLTAFVPWSVWAMGGWGEEG